MQRDLHGPGHSAPAHTGLLVTRHGWRAQDWLERAALERMAAAGPVPMPGSGTQPVPGSPAGALPVYAGFPWSAYLDSLECPETLEAPYLQAAFRRLALLAPRQAGMVTVCQHPRLPDHLDRLAAAGVTDVFWTGPLPLPASQPRPAGITLHPFPALPDPGTCALNGEGPEAAFVFCPADAGGNTPRLWGAVAAGLIPVLPLSALALPGPAGLWRAATVLQDATEPGLADRRAGVLTGILAGIVADPARLAAMRQALAGLHLLFGSGRMIHDVLLCLLARSGEAARQMPHPEEEGDLLGPLIRRFGDRDSLTPAEAALVLQQMACDLLCAPAGISGGNAGGDLLLASGPRSASAWQLVAMARSALPASDPRITRFDAVIGHLRVAARQSLQAGAGQTGVEGTDRAAVTDKQAGGKQVGSRAAPALRVFLLGQGTPLSSAPLCPHLGDRITFVDRAEEAGLIVTGNLRDLEENRDLLAGLMRAGASGDDSRPRLVVLSQDPSRDSPGRGDGRPLPYCPLNPATSGIFAFHHLPWSVLRAESFPVRYALLMSEFAAMTPGALLRHWQQAPLQAVFPADPDDVHPGEDAAGLCLYRRRVAELTSDLGPGRGGPVLRLGGSQDLPDWHLDKLVRLQGRLRVCAAYETTLHRDHITEKPFDAFAIGAVPAVVAEPGHRLADLILPEAMLNTAFAPPDVAAARIAAFVPDLIRAEAWLETVQGLLGRFRDTARLLDERQRIADACIAELRRAVRDDPSALPAIA